MVGPGHRSSASVTSDNVHHPGINEAADKEGGESAGLNSGRGPPQSASSDPIQIVFITISPARLTLISQQKWSQNVPLSRFSINGPSLTPIVSALLNVSK